MDKRNKIFKAAKSQLSIAGVFVLQATFFVTFAFASGGLVGDCADCHTMHNSYQGVAVAKTGTTGTITTTPLPNLLKMDCIACHVVDPAGSDKIVNMANGSAIPQVWHADGTGDLAGGNFSYIASGGDRKGHNVVDLFPSGDATLQYPPGFRAGYPAGQVSADHAAFTWFDPASTSFTCAGSKGCHGMRNQLLVEADGFVILDDIPRTGLAALSGLEGPGNPFSGAHHNSYDGVKLGGFSPDFTDSPLAESYRFIRGLQGYGNEVERWQNNSSTSHNEYIGGYSELSDVLRDTNYATTSTCSRCHTGGQNSLTSRMTVPSTSMTGFCITCHANFHSSGATNGTSGAFLRHPSDWIIPDEGEYAAYATYDISAPVARPWAFLDLGQGVVAPSDVVTPGTDLVMCLSCHMAHASPYDSMLRFDYASMTSQMVAGSFASIADAQDAGGCLACHTTKGVLPENR